MKNELIKHTYTRFELSFGKQLEETLRPLNIEIETQKPIFGGKYRIDFYLPEFNLAIEYDEGQHNYQQEEDKQREEEIKKELGYKIIRLDYKNSDSYNVGLVLKEIMGRQLGEDKKVKNSNKLDKKKEIVQYLKNLDGTVKEILGVYKDITEARLKTGYGLISISWCISGVTKYAFKNDKGERICWDYIDNFEAKYPDYKL